MVVKLLKEVVKRMNMDPALVEDICLGNVGTIFVGLPNRTLGALQKHAEAHPDPLTRMIHR